MTPIIVAMRAPVLSATSSLDRICTIGFLLLNDFHESPSLQFAHWAHFHDANSVAGLRLVLFVVRIKFLHLLNNLTKLRVWHARDCTHDDCLVHSAGNHLARACLARGTSCRVSLRRC